MNHLQATRPIHPTTTLYLRAAALLLLAAATGVILIGPRKFQTELSNILLAPPAIADTPVVPVLASPEELATEQRARELDALLHMHWENAMLAVEHANIAGVTILEFHPDLSAHMINLHGEAKDFESLTSYIKQLNSTGLVHGVALMHEQGVSREHVDTIEFDLSGSIKND